MEPSYKILVVAPAWVGDMVMSQTLLKLLKQQHADRCQIDVLVNDWARDVVRRMPEVNQVHINPFKHGELALGARVKLGRQLMSYGYHQAIVLPNSWKSALIPAVARIPRRTGFVGEMRYGLLNEVYKLDKQALPLMIDRFAALANQGSKPAQHAWPQLMLDSNSQQHLIAKLGLELIRPVVCLCPAAEYGPAKRWPTTHFASLADQLQAQGYQVWILGSAKDQTIGAEICAQAHNTTNLFNLCGATSLVEVIDLLSLAQAVVTNDSGLMHIACAVGRPVIAIYGSSSPGFTPPLSTQAEIVSLNLDCAPCFARTCKFGHYQCLQGIQPHQIAAKIADLVS